MRAFIPMLQQTVFFVQCLQWCIKVLIHTVLLLLWDFFFLSPLLITETCIFILQCILEVQELSCLLKLIALERYTAFLHRRIENYTKRKLTNESWLLCKVQHWEKVCCVTIPCVHFPQLWHVLVCPFCSVIVRFTSTFGEAALKCEIKIILHDDITSSWHFISMLFVLCHIVQNLKIQSDIYLKCTSMSHLPI